jgi:DNA-directed RNA polymerase subunit beta'
MPNISEGGHVTAGMQLTEGAKNPHQILKVQGADACQLYLLSEVQDVYRNQGVNIADKHFEIVIRKMLSKVQITKSGGSTMLPGELMDRLHLLHMNEQLLAEGQEPASGVPVLLGVTKAALSTDSFLSAASFQHTIKVLAGAAIEGKEDRLYGLKENVIIGKLIPAGTGFHTYQDRELVAPNVTLEDQGALDADAEVDLDAIGDTPDMGPDGEIAAP